MVDMAHIAGLVAAGCIRARCRTRISSRRRPTRRCADRAPAWCCASEQYAKDLDRAVFPGVQGGPLMHVIAAKAVVLKEALEPAFKDYQRQIVAQRGAAGRGASAQAASASSAAAPTTT